MTLGTAAAQIAPIYNLGLVIIAVYLFIKLFRTPVKNKKVYLLPWKLLFFAVIVFILEEVLTVLRLLDVVNIPVHVNGFFEVIIIGTFIYALLLQREHVNN